MPKARDTSIDILRSLGIIAVVCSHSNIVCTLVSLFHNPLFMFASGMFHSVKPSESLGEYGHFVWRRIKRVYVPFVIITLLLTITQPLLSAWHIADAEPYSLAEMPMKILTVFAMRMESINGPSWFLISYLEISFLFEAIRYIEVKLKPCGIWGNALLLAIAIILYPIGIYTNLPRCLDESATLFLWYLMGFFMRTYHDHFTFWRNTLSPQSKRFLLAGMILSLLAGIFLLVRLSEIGCDWRGGALPPTVAMCTAMGILFSWILAQLLDTLPFRGLLGIAGKESFSIMVWHIGAFRLLSLVLASFSDYTPKALANGLGVQVLHTWGRYVYCITGVLLPIVGVLVYRRLMSIITVYWERHHSHDHSA